MKQSEVTILLTAAKVIDDRVGVDAAKAAAWHSMLDPDIPLEYARDVLTSHYATRTDAIMPAHFNLAWAGEKRALSARAETEARLRALDEAKAHACPPPPEFREMVARFRKTGQL